MKLLLLSPLIFVAGCAFVTTPERAATASPDMLCIEYGQAFRRAEYERQGMLWREIQRRGLMDNPEILIVREKLIKVGLSKCGLIASWGFPDRTNRSVGSWGVREQLVYGRSYVYIHNGVVSSYQN